MLENIPLQDDECLKHEHQAYSYVAELVVMNLMKVSEYSEIPKQLRLATQKEKASQRKTPTHFFIFHLCYHNCGWTGWACIHLD